jgi:DNA-binding NarL/FixJ family response regulator
VDSNPRPAPWIPLLSAVAYATFPSATHCRVLLVDDHALFRQTLRRLLNAVFQPGLVGEASDGQEAVENVARLQPSVVLMDIDLHRMMDGIAATRLITQSKARGGRAWLFV